MASTQYKKVKPEMLLNGMFPNTDLFYIVDKHPVLLSHNCVIDVSTMDRLHKIVERGVDVFVEEETFYNLQEQYEIISKKNQEIATKYVKTKKEMGSFLDETQASQLIDMESVLRLLSSIEDSLSVMNPSFLLQWASYIDDMDEILQAHSVDVAILNGMIGRWLGYKKEDISNLIIIGLLHDLGKLSMPSEILNKPGKLTIEEFEVIKKHPIYSYELVRKSGINNPVILSGVRGHHEKASGTGYPDHLKFDEIPFFAKITSISDIYDAMISKRVYKAASSPLNVLENFYKVQFSDLDIDLLIIFLVKLV